MSRTKELKLNPENNVPMAELFSNFVPEGKSKYLDLLFRIMKGTDNFKSHVDEIKKHYSEFFEVPVEVWNDVPDLQLVYFHRIIDTTFAPEDLKSFIKFCQYNERNLIKQNDLSKYKNFSEINNSVSVAETLNDVKIMEKQIKVLLNDDEWLILRPLTFESSKKYGSNTKWCTTQQNNPDYFMKYAKRGVLIYCLNKTTGYKVASFCSLDKNEPEFSFWNQKDARIDSLEANIPDNVRLLIKEESLNKGAKTNRFILDNSERIKEEKMLGGNYKSGSISEITEQEQPALTERPNRIGRAIERMEEEVGLDELVSEMPEPIREDMVTAEEVPQTYRG